MVLVLRVSADAITHGRLAFAMWRLAFVTSSFSLRGFFGAFGFGTFFGFGGLVGFGGFLGLGAALCLVITLP
jgi:hypothetical protein